jgi:hypothetical protein
MPLYTFRMLDPKGQLDDVSQRELENDKVALLEGHALKDSHTIEILKGGAILAIVNPPRTPWPKLRA